MTLKKIGDEFNVITDGFSRLCAITDPLAVGDEDINLIDDTLDHDDEPLSLVLDLRELLPLKRRR